MNFLCPLVPELLKKCWEESLKGVKKPIYNETNLAYVKNSEIYLLVMVCNSCVYFLKKFRPIGFSKDDLFTSIERTKLTVIFGYSKSTIIRIGGSGLM